jgi:RND family efflux transporter MFP subunit
LLLIVGAVAGAVVIEKTSPKARKRQPVRIIPIVQAEKVYPTNQQITVPAMGTVIPARETILKSRVSGEVVSIHPDFMEGGFIKKGEVVVQIDPEDHELIVAQKKSAVVNAEYALKLELGHQEVAKHEWNLLKSDEPASPNELELALRKPHLEKVEADLTAARAELEQANLNLSRTTVRSPYNSIVRKKYVDIGSQVSGQEQLAEIIGTDEYWIQVSIPVERLKWIYIPRDASDEGSPVRIRFRNGHERSGRVIKLLGDLETEGRMARVMVSVPDPLCLKAPDMEQPPLLIGEYVRVEIKGREIETLYRIPHGTLHDGSKIWVAGNSDKLEIRQAEVIWRDTDFVLIRDGLNPGDRLIVSDLAVPVDGMPVKIDVPKPDKRAGYSASQPVSE